MHSIFRHGTALGPCLLSNGPRVVEALEDYDRQPDDPRQNNLQGTWLACSFGSLYAHYKQGCTGYQAFFSIWYPVAGPDIWLSSDIRWPDISAGYPANLLQNTFLCIKIIFRNCCPESLAWANPTCHCSPARSQSRQDFIIDSKSVFHKKQLSFHLHHFCAKYPQKWQQNFHFIQSSL